MLPNFYSDDLALSQESRYDNILYFRSCTTTLTEQSRGATAGLEAAEQ
jgi:hypothetical protein